MALAQGLSEAASKVLAGVSVIPRLDWHGSAAKFTHLAVGRLRPSLAVGPRHQLLATWASLQGYS